MRFAQILVVAFAAAAFTAAPAAAHQTTTSNGATVTLHVNPDDAPEAGSPATIRVLSVRVRRPARFRYSSCRCRLKITDASGAVLLDRAMTTRTTFTFPSAAAYRLTYSGRYRRGSRTKKFATSFAIRAN